MTANLVKEFVSELLKRNFSINANIDEFLTKQKCGSKIIMRREGIRIVIRTTHNSYSFMNTLQPIRYHIAVWCRKETGGYIKKEEWWRDGLLSRIDDIKIPPIRDIHEKQEFLPGQIITKDECAHFACTANGWRCMAMVGISGNVASADFLINMNTDVWFILCDVYYNYVLSDGYVWAPVKGKDVSRKYSIAKDYRLIRKICRNRLMIGDRELIRCAINHWLVAHELDQIEFKEIKA